jgi:ABC-2 type transport system permease protein
MLEYMKSEWYRQKHNIGFFMMVAVSICLVIAVPTMIFLLQDGNIPSLGTQFTVKILIGFMPGVWSMAIVYCSFLENYEKLKQGAVKNAVSFGIPREHLVLGKFFLELLICTALYILLPLIYSGVSLLLLNHANMGEFQELLRAFFATYPLCIALMALSLVLIMNMGNTFSCALAIMALTFFLPVLLDVIGIKYPILKEIAAWFPKACVAAKTVEEGNNWSYIWSTNSGVLKCWIIGILWTVVYLTGGCFWFKKREIR